MRSRFLILIIVELSLFGIKMPVAAQEPPDSLRMQIEDLRKEVERVKGELAELKNLQAGVPQSQSDELDQLEDRLDRRLRELENKIDAVSRASAPTAFNPRMTASMNVAARADDKTVYDSQGETQIQNRPFLRTVELDLRAPVDPFAEAVAIVSLEDQAGKGFEIDAEEAYGLIKRIPVLETAPLGMKIKVGKFRAAFGVDNKLHMHDLPWTTRPLAVTKYLGTEHGEFFESGLNPIGIDFDFFVPNPIPSSTLEMNLDLLRAGDIGLSLGNSGKQPAYLAHLNWSRDWENVHLLTLGLSAYREDGFPSTYLYGADITYKWSPVERRDIHSFVMGGEIFLGRNIVRNELDLNHDGVPDLIQDVTNKPLGWFAYAQYQLSWWVYLGGRYEVVDEPTNDKLNTKALSGYLSYYTTEFLRFRLGIEHRTSDLPQHQTVNSALLEINFVFGSHPTEPYWVSR
jgi:hypothetical protein